LNSIKETIRKCFKNVPDFPGSICASVNDEVVHGIPGLRVLKDGDIISVDIGAYIDGFHVPAKPKGSLMLRGKAFLKVWRKR